MLITNLGLNKKKKKILWVYKYEKCVGKVGILKVIEKGVFEIKSFDFLIEWG